MAPLTSRRRVRARIGAIALVGVLCSGAREAWADDAPDPDPTTEAPNIPSVEPALPALPAESTELTELTVTPRVRLRYDLALDLAVTGGLAATVIALAAVIKPALNTPTCSICDPDNGRVNAVDDFFRTALKHSNGSTAGSISDVVAYGAAPAVGVSLAIIVPVADKRGDEAPLDMLLVTEAALTFALVQQSLATLVPRERPEVHAAQGDVRESSLRRRSSFESFPAGHNGAAFAIAAAGGTVATMRGYRLAPVVWIAGGVLALAASYLRIAADRHYFTDIAAGAVLGTGIGIAVPLLFHRPVKYENRAAARRLLDGARISTSEIPGGRIVGVGGRF